MLRRHEHAKHRQTEVSLEQSSFLTSALAAEILQSLIGLEQRVTAQTRAIQALKSRALASPPTRPLLDEVRMHWIEAQTTLAALTVFWCNDGSVAMRMKEDLKSRLLEEIEDMRVLTNAPIGPVTCKVIEI